MSKHPFLTKPHKTLITLSIPVFFSLVAEPLTGIVDTIFVKQLGSAALAALGVGTTALSGVFWLFNFLSVGTQTEVAQAMGKGESHRASQIMSLALTLAVIFGTVVLIILWLFAEPLSQALAATGDILDNATSYIRVRAWGAPAVLLSTTAFGTLRGLQDMRTPSWIAVGMNALNMLLDALLVTGAGFLPALGIQGVAWASTISLWLGAIVALTFVGRQLGFTTDFSWRDAKDLLVIGGDLFIRTGLLLLYMMVATREATAIGEDGGAANQAVRQVFLFTALGLDAFAITTQSLVGYFYGANDLPTARQVVRLAMGWAFGMGIVLGLGMWLARGLIISAMVPETAISLFLPAWFVVAMSQPINSVTYITDGAHWGTGDYRYLRNVMLVATIVGISIILLVETHYEWQVAVLWTASLVWTIIRGGLGVARIWPGIGQAPLAVQHKPPSI